MLFRSPLTTRLLALSGAVPVSTLLRQVLDALLGRYATELSLDNSDRISIYEKRDTLYLAALHARDATYSLIQAVVQSWLDAHAADTALRTLVNQALVLDRALSPRPGNKTHTVHEFDFDARAILGSLDAMEQIGRAHV